jgi:hypothetical protein
MSNAERQSIAIDAIHAMLRGNPFADRGVFHDPACWCWSDDPDAQQRRAVAIATAYRADEEANGWKS